VPVRRLYQPCRAPWVDMCVLANGDVIPCLDYKVGNVRQETLAAIWNGERFRRFRRLLRQEEILGACQTCCYCKIRPEAVT
jgi:radical SAM protein with 4Fe4S-binding SPASM domain